MSPQETFNIMARGLLQQGGKSTGANGKCLFRGPSGKRCAVGFLIPDEQYHPGMEGDANGTIRALERAGHSEALMREVLAVHDNAPIDQWPKYLSAVANIYDLNDEVVRASTETFLTKRSGHVDDGFPPKDWGHWTQKLPQLPAEEKVSIEHYAPKLSGYDVWNKMTTVCVPKKVKYASYAGYFDDMPIMSSYEEIKMSVADAVKLGYMMPPKAVKGNMFYANISV